MTFAAKQLEGRVHYTYVKFLNLFVVDAFRLYFCLLSCFPSPFFEVHPPKNKIVCLPLLSGVETSIQASGSQTCWPASKKASMPFSSWVLPNGAGPPLKTIIPHITRTAANTRAWGGTINRNLLWPIETGGYLSP